MRASFIIGLLAFAGTWWWRTHSDNRDEVRARTHNFSAGPGRLPDEVMEQVAAEFLNYGGDTGMSFLEMSHRDTDGPVQQTMIQAEADLRELLEIPPNYHVLFMHGGAHGQFSAVPLNLQIGPGKAAYYVTTGFWSSRAASEAEKHGKIERVSGVKKVGGQEVLLPASEWKIPQDAAYVHICASETIHGIEFLKDPSLDAKVHAPLVADFTSTLLSRRVDISRYGLIYASGGKNLGPAGFTLVIVRKDLVGPNTAHPATPSILNYHLAATSQPIPSIYNTPPTFQIYVHSLILRELKKRGGLQVVEADAIKRAKLIYDVIDASNGFYSCTAAPADRSRMSIPFRIAGSNAELESLFLKRAESEKRMTQLFGHKIVGGLRATLYNGVPTASIKILAAFMKDFQQQHASATATAKHETA